MRNPIKLSLMLSMIALVAFPALSYADRGHHHGDRHFYRYHDRPHFGLSISFMPQGHLTLRSGSHKYYYYDGIYYSPVGAQYVVVAPPVGATVTAIPAAYSPVVINGITYYVDNGIYYVHTSGGYQVVPQPVVALPPAVVAAPATVPVTAAPVPADAAETFTINIPNSKGAYTPVIIKRSGTGFVGPQGEFYAEFPKVAQLKVMYDK